MKRPDIFDKCVIAIGIIALIVFFCTIAGCCYAPNPDAWKPEHAMLAGRIHKIEVSAAEELNTISDLRQRVDKAEQSINRYQGTADLALDVANESREIAKSATVAKPTTVGEVGTNATISTVLVGLLLALTAMVKKRIAKRKTAHA